MEVARFLYRVESIYPFKLQDMEGVLYAWFLRFVGVNEDFGRRGDPQLTAQGSFLSGVSLRLCN